MIHWQIGRELDADERRAVVPVAAEREYRFAVRAVTAVAGVESELSTTLVVRHANCAAHIGSDGRSTMTRHMVEAVVAASTASTVELCWGDVQADVADRVAHWVVEYNSARDPRLKRVCRSHITPY